MKRAKQQPGWMEKRRRPGTTKSVGVKLARRLLKRLDEAKEGAKS